MKSEADSADTQPILVVLVWRGGLRFQRALDSIRDAEKYFKRIILSITAAPDSEDMQLAEQYLRTCALTGRPSRAEIICTQVELPTMQHQKFWINHLLATGANLEDAIFWLAYDDQLRLQGLREVVPNELRWPLKRRHAYFGPWGIRHERPDVLWQPKQGEALEIWTSFQTNGPIRLNPIKWCLEQLRQPTYIQMSGSVASLRSHANLVYTYPRKLGPMRIEMATALAPGIDYVTEFPTALTYIYGRSNSDRSNYAKVAAREDRDLAFRLFLKCARSPKLIPSFLGEDLRSILSQKIHREVKSEEWRVRSIETD